MVEGEQIMAAVDGEDVKAVQEEAVVEVEEEAAMKVEEEAAVEEEEEAAMEEEEEAAMEVEEEGAVVVEEEAAMEEEVEVEDPEVLELRLQKIFAEIDRNHARIDKLFAQAANIRTNVLEPTTYTSTCEACIQPMVCGNCGVRGELSVFLCCGCRLPVQQGLCSCEVCGKSIQPMNTWCTDCTTTAALDKDGFCMLCGRSPSELSKDEDNESIVPDTEAN
jgi:hypothetical protein